MPVSVRVSRPKRLNRAVMPKSPPCWSAALLLSGMVCTGGARFSRRSRFEVALRERPIAAEACSWV
jgi:hypothetical protein